MVIQVERDSIRAKLDSIRYQRNTAQDALEETTDRLDSALAELSLLKSSNNTSDE